MLRTPPQNLDISADTFEESYRLLDRLKQDCDYFLGCGGRSEKHLWAGSVDQQISKMRDLYAQVSEKPEWLTEQDIDRYEMELRENLQIAPDLMGDLESPELEDDELEL